jgi:ABC-2 type transport system permease protein
MKSRTSFFNGPVFRKDLTRFAPAWGLYSVLLFLGYVGLMMGDAPYYRATSLVDLTVAMALVNFGFAFVNAQLLFGDLFSSRLCNALHAMPLRRECWYGTHLAAGITFSLMPNLVFCGLGMLTMGLGKAWMLPLLWVLASTLQYLCFFGLAVVCIMLTGNRFASALVYGLVNFFSMLVYWLVDSLYEPLLTGIRVKEAPFAWFAPLIQMLGDNNLMDVLSQRIMDSYGDFSHRLILGVNLGEGWFWLAGYAVLGILLLGVGLVLYRKRALECAGDFMAFRDCEPVLLIVYTVTVGGCFHLFSDIFGGVMKYLLLSVGLAVGFFTGLMLLQRTTRVFRLKTFGAFGLFAAVMALSLGLTWLDPLGITRWVPEADQVVCVNLSDRYQHYSYSEGDLDLTEETDIQAMVDVHGYMIGRTAKDEMLEYGSNRTKNVCLEYTLKNGRTVTRFYDVNVLGDAGQALKPYFSSFEYVMGFREEEIPELARKVFQINAQGTHNNYEEFLVQMQGLDMEELLRCIAADCAAGTMVQSEYYHLQKDPVSGDLMLEQSTYLEIGFEEPVLSFSGSVRDYRYLTVFDDSINTLNWMIENGLYDPDKNLG